MQLRAPRATAAFAALALLASAAVPVWAQAPATRPATRPAATPIPRPATAPVTRPAQAAATRPALPAVPASVSDLKALERRVEEITQQVMPAVVGVQANGGQGSGVIISPDGYVLTAAHVSGGPDREVELILASGRRVAAKTLGTNKEIDAGLMKITDEGGNWPHVPVGKSADLAKGQWVLALGHPGGYQRGRPPVLRLGRVLSSSSANDWVVTDCTLVGGDSGGPLFDLEGNVVGIHSRIGPPTLANMHTPADAYTTAWDRLAAGEVWGERFAFLTARGPMLGIGGDADESGAGVKIGAITANGPAAKAGMRLGDIVTQFDGKPVQTMEELAQLISKKRPDDVVSITVLRDGKKTELKATLARRPRG